MPKVEKKMPWYVVGVEHGAPQFQEVRVLADGINGACAKALLALENEESPRIVEIHEVESPRDAFYSGTPRAVPEHWRLARAWISPRLPEHLQQQFYWEATPEGVSRQNGHEWTDFTGRARGSADGIGWADDVFPQDLPRVWAEWRQCVAAGLPIDTTFRIRSRAAAWVWVKSVATPVIGRDGAVQRYIGVSSLIDPPADATYDDLDVPHLLDQAAPALLLTPNNQGNHTNHLYGIASVVRINGHASPAAHERSAYRHRRRRR
jgi:PAS domain-containing protein